MFLSQTQADVQREKLAIISYRSRQHFEMRIGSATPTPARALRHKMSLFF
jgi:hypothetical protein